MLSSWVYANTVGCIAMHCCEPCLTTTNPVRWASFSKAGVACEFAKCAQHVFEKQYLALPPRHSARHFMRKAGFTVCPLLTRPALHAHMLDIFIGRSGSIIGGFRYHTAWCEHPLAVSGTSVCTLLLSCWVCHAMTRNISELSHVKSGSCDGG